MKRISQRKTKRNNHDRSNPDQSKNIVSVNDGKAVTDSLKVAQVFGKEHSKVLRAIRELNVPKDFNEANFGLVEYIDAKNEKRPMYTMTRNGFVVLVMGFTSKGLCSSSWRTSKHLI